MFDRWSAPLDQKAVSSEGTGKRDALKGKVYVETKLEFKVKKKNFYLGNIPRAAYRDRLGVNNQHLPSYPCDKARVARKGYFSITSFG